MKNKQFLSFSERIKSFVHKQILLFKYYSFFPEKKKIIPCCVLIIDEKINNGGLADRLKGIIGVYLMCKIQKKPFKLFYSSPFEMKDILTTNHYNWIIDKQNLSNNIWNSEVQVLFSLRGFKSSQKKQCHIYNIGGGDNISLINSDLKTNYSFNELFNELFKPSKLLQEKIDNLKELLENKLYISVCYRFQSSLGDFYEGDISSPLEEKDKKILIEKCINALSLIIDKHKYMIVLVTSDSITFLDIIKEITNVRIIPGKVVHMNYTTDQDINVYIKSFLDLYMLSMGEKIYRIIGDGLYASGFPHIASLIGNIEMEDIKI